MRVIPDHQRLRPARKGAAAVELSLVFPILFTIMIGAIEMTRANQVANAATFAAYQGCRQAITPGATVSAATSAAQQVLNSNSIGSSTIVISPSVITDTTPTVTTVVTVNLSSVGWVAPLFTKGKTISRSCTLTRENTL